LKPAWLIAGLPLVVLLPVPCALQVAKFAEAAAKSMTLDEQQVQQLEKFVQEAFQEIDKAVSKGTLHANTGSRRKARVSLLKRQALIAGGLYAPKPENPGYFYYQRMEARRSLTAAAAAN
jgi:small subunit ribosomal protein S20